MLEGLTSTTPKLLGAILLDQIQHVRESHGETALEAARAELSEEDRVALDSVLSLSWIEVGLAERYKAAIALNLGMAPLELQREVVRAGVERTLHGVWRFVAKHLVSDAALAKRLPMLYTKTFDRGTTRVESFGDGRAKLVLEGWPEIPTYDVVGLVTGVETVLTLAGRKVPQAAWKREDGRVVFDVRWSKG